MTMSSDQSRGDEVLKREHIEGPLWTTGRLDGMVNVFCHWVSPLRIIVGSPGVLLVEDGLVPLEALHIGVVDILGKGNEIRRRKRSVGSRHFVWRMGWWFKGQWLILLLSAHDRHALLWSPLPLPQDSSVCQPDKPWIFWLHLIPMSFGVWTIFSYLLTHPFLFLSLLCHLTHPYLLLPHLIFHDSESALFILYLSPPMSIIGLWSVHKTCPKHVPICRSGVCCWHSPDLISTWISPPPVSSTATLGLFLLITQSRSWSLTYCVFEALRRKLAQ